MTERFLNAAMWMVIIGLLSAVAVAGLLVGYCSLYSLASLQWQAGLLGIAISAGCGYATVLMCRHRQDLI